MRLCQPPDGSTSPKYILLCFITTKTICKEKNALAFNRDRCCHLVICLWLIPFHCLNTNIYSYLETSIWLSKFISILALLLKFHSFSFPCQTYLLEITSLATFTKLGMATTWPLLQLKSPLF